MTYVWNEVSRKWHIEHYHTEETHHNQLCQYSKLTTMDGKLILERRCFCHRHHHQARKEFHYRADCYWNRTRRFGQIVLTKVCYCSGQRHGFYPPNLPVNEPTTRTQPCHAVHKRRGYKSFGHGSSRSRGFATIERSILFTVSFNVYKYLKAAGHSGITSRSECRANEGNTGPFYREFAEAEAELDPGLCVENTSLASGGTAPEKFK
ncbi:hypothetical protein Bbelb_171780 [Branchiostoma belcheri]|nr:hypothetical protein Bbelb_171780 [Branchiostoma belcheri]